MSWPDSLALLEWSATLTTALCVVLAARRHIATWPVGIVGSALYMRLFHDTQLYADATLQLFFIGTGFWGWRAWLRQAHANAAHTPHAAPRWKGHTVNVDTGCAFGGYLSALRYPERTTLSVPARAVYAPPPRPLPVPEGESGS